MSDTTPKNKDPRIEVFNGRLSDGRFFESVYHPELTPALQFVVALPHEQATIQESVVDGSKTKYPPANQIKWIEKESIMLPSGVADYGCPNALLQRMKEYVGQYLDFRTFDISLIAHYAMMTWVWDEFSAFPYLRFKGEPNTGKTRCLEVMKQLCYRSTSFSGSGSKSALFHLIDAVRGTTLIDESEYDSDLKSDLIKILNRGYCKNGTHEISIKKGDNWIPEIYNVGCPKVFTNRMDFPDNALETRCLTIFTQSKKLADRIPIELPVRFFSDGLVLRNQLLQWRINTLNSINKSEAELRHLDGRAIQLALPLYSISPDARFKKKLLEHLNRRSGELREQEPLRIVLEAAISVRQHTGKDDISVESVKQEALRLANSRDVSVYRFTSRRVAELAKRGLGFKPIRRNSGAYILADLVTIKRQSEHLRLSFGVDSDARVAPAA